MVFIKGRYPLDNGTDVRYAQEFIVGSWAWKFRELRRIQVFLQPWENISPLLGKEALAVTFLSVIL